MNKKIVIKIGSDCVSTASGINRSRIDSLARDIKTLRELGYEVVCAGMKILGSLKGIDDLAVKRALAAIGQCYLVNAWSKSFSPKVVAQILLTWNELNDDESRLKARETIQLLLANNVVPIINENDAVADDELRFSDNDYLAFRVAKLINASHLILLTDVEGLFNADPKVSKEARIIREINQVDEELIGCISNTQSEFGKGGMLSKVLVAKDAMESGITTNIINGKKEGLLLSLLRDGEMIGTRFKKEKNF